jgi:hypothetical protein
VAQPTHEDATLVVQLAQWSSTAGLVEALDWIFSDGFVSDHTQFVINFPPTSERYRQVHTTLNYFETVGTLHKHGLINEQLLLDWLAVEASGTESRALRSATGSSTRPMAGHSHCESAGGGPRL